jgi:hypothetical protein
MLPQDVLKKDAQKLMGCWREDGYRDNEFLRAYMIPVIADLGALIAKHAARMAADSGQDCAFQLDRFGELIIWQLCEYLTQSGCEGEFMEHSAHVYQIDERHARDWFDWPPSPAESEA